MTYKDYNCKTILMRTKKSHHGGNGKHRPKQRRVLTPQQLRKKMMIENEIKQLLTKIIAKEMADGLSETEATFKVMKTLAAKCGARVRFIPKDFSKYKN